MSGAILKQHVIDCDARPFVLDGCSVVIHQKGGELVWDAEAQRDALYLSPNQEKIGRIEGHKLLEELREKSIPVLNANVLRYIREKPFLVSEKDWGGRAIFFWGTIYGYRNCGLFVDCLFWFNHELWWGHRTLDGDWGKGDLAAIRAV